MPSPLAALSPLDGRYAKSADPLRGYFSEQALIRYRVRIELEWLQALAAAGVPLVPVSHLAAAAHEYDEQAGDRRGRGRERRARPIPASAAYRISRPVAAGPGPRRGRRSPSAART